LRSCVSDSIRLFRVRFPVEAGQALFAFQFFAFAFPFPAAPTLSEVLSRNSHPLSEASGRTGALAASR
ncbi:hypothetical protein FKN01_27505, partial [Streptomyces sp. 130]